MKIGDLMEGLAILQKHHKDSAVFADYEELRIQTESGEMPIEDVQRLVELGWDQPERHNSYDKMEVSNYHAFADWVKIL